ncbi:MAG: 30S ribosomal protein S1 [Desulfobacteraceae bacterium]|nr:30S ribosomal protein S1 [Desulfobacteraceae bacterium]MDH3720552.1 30S ribosomal protein S1 [Desulfobacteraceae bacterium]MDH3836688.1 30S ribosomal protein S1 [Desulfobacteraceae bacterium]MDH3872984.1 30S ribosomal protein S1 [Desulfobacteraceae bacterium]PLX43766.1 MAG: 30S ribosomal protein S1 [Desulfobacteraceae bacterium]
MENFETNDSNKVLTNDTSSEQSDAEGIKEQDVLKTDSSEEETPSDDIQDPVNVSADAQETTIDAKEDQETTGALEEVTEVIGDSEESPVTLEGSKTADKPSENMADMMDMYEESFKRFAEGEVVTGRIISVDKDYVLVDIGYKSEGQIRIQEFQGEDGNLVANEGDSVDVMVEWWDDEEERVVLSKEKAAKVKVWEAIKKSFDEDQTVEGVIVNRVKGGFSVDIGVQAFLPGSQADLRPIRNLDEMVGKTFTFKILKYNRKRSNIVLSRRVILEEERDSKRTATLESIEDGNIVDGIVKNITEYGVFVDLGGVDGLLHITDISWGRVKHPSELFSVGDKITVKILSFDIERERVSLGMKQLTEDPWLAATEKYPIGSRVNGKVVSLTDYGSFVELEEGIEGLIHVSEMSWTRKIRHPSKVVSVGDVVDTIVLDIKPESRRISLGMKQVVPNPWDVISEKYPVGTTIEGKIKNITDFGLFIGIGEGIDGLVHISDISWIKRIKHPSELYKKGDVVQAIVLDIEKENERFSLGIKQLEEDPWKTVAERYEVGKEITGTVTNLTDFGVFVEIEEGIEGLVHVSEISKEKIKTPIGKFSIGDVITAKVMNINSQERRIGLSIKRLEIESEQSFLSEYVNNARPTTSTFGEILRENLQEKLNGE